MRIKDIVRIGALSGLLGLGGCATYDMRTDSGLAATLVDPTGIIGGVSKEIFGTGGNQQTAQQQSSVPLQVTAAPIKVYGTPLGIYDNVSWHGNGAKGRIAIYENQISFTSTDQKNWFVLPYAEIYDIKVKDRRSLTDIWKEITYVTPNRDFKLDLLKNSFDVSDKSIRLWIEHKRR